MEPLKVAEILSVHNSSQAEQALPDILGDAYLLNTNPIYGKVRAFALKIGTQFVEAYPQYLLLPFHELNTIVTTKKVPFVPNGRMLGEIESKRPGIFHIDEMRMPESYHLHESSHVIAEHLFGDFVPADGQEKILKAILCESFANTVDAMACAYASDEIHRVFLEHNCYMHPQKKTMEVMNRLTEALGLKFTFMLTFFGYVHANFLREGLSVEMIKKLASYYAPGKELSKKLVKDCESLSRIGEKLDPRFRVITTEVYLRMEGHEGEIYEILDFEFMDVFNGKPTFSQVTEALAGVVI